MPEIPNHSLVQPLKQLIIADWVRTNFGANILFDRNERGKRTLEEAVEVAQSVGITCDEIIAIVDRVYSKPVGEPYQEVGGLGVTLLALCSCLGFSMDAAIQDEIARIHTFPPEYWQSRQNAKAVAGVGHFVPGPGANS